MAGMTPSSEVGMSLRFREGSCTLNYSRRTEFSLVARHLVSTWVVDSTMTGTLEVTWTGRALGRLLGGRCSPAA
jgi:hypothetical protein